MLNMIIYVECKIDLILRKRYRLILDFIISFCSLGLLGLVAPISIIIERQRKKPDTNPFVYVFIIELLILNKC